MRRWAIRFAVVALLMGAVSCHTTRHTTRSGHDATTHSGSGTGKVDENWAKLDIKLTRNDNKKLYKELKGWLGVPYRYGGQSKDGTDCSGFVMQIYLAVYDKKIERNSAKIFEKNCKEIKKKDLREGDLVFFSTGSTWRISHVGLYLKDNKFIHASSSRGVVVSDLDQKYYVQHYYSSGRVK